MYYQLPNNSVSSSHPPPEARPSSGSTANPYIYDQRRHISEIAYFMAMERGFMGGNEIHDWLAAERQVLRGRPVSQE